ncbi:glomulin-like isoform X2 [Armigeres subalbatus]|uniref:glomulin-like isoform X2 n=1 Tax=Armigeres subalbatus TaxID=124917 RepID=UPI002ED21E12
MNKIGKLLALQIRYSSCKDVKTYSRQVVEDLISVMCNLLGDPFQLLPYGEKRMRWRCSRTRQNDSPILNIFMSEEKCPRLGLAMYHYFLLGEDLLPSTTPTVYAKHHIFEMCLYYCVTLMTHDQSSAHHKGIMLAKRLLKIMAVDKLTSDNLDVQIHQEFCTSLSKLIVYSSSERTRKDGTFLLRDYILQFDSKGSYLVIANLLKTIKHSGLHSYVSTIYKDLVNKHLNCVDEPDAWFVGASLKHLLLTEICVLIDGIGTDLVENSDTVITGLNVLRFLLIRDKLNQTGIWEYTTEIEQNYLLPLRKSLDLSKAHFKEEQSTVIQSRTSIKDSEVDVCVSVINGESVPEINREKKLELLNDAFNKFDLMECLLARVIDCMNSNPKNT